LLTFTEKVSVAVPPGATVLAVLPQATVDAVDENAKAVPLTPLDVHWFAG
jgi:hypothetical protein